MILVIFGSDSDKEVYDEICKGLGETDYKVSIISAHKTPDELEKMEFDKYDIIIAGAGLAAHLPGVIASKTIKPVIGVPCRQNYEGLDALLSIVQMPPGVPVLGVGVNQAKNAASNAIKMLKVYKGVNVIGQANIASKAISFFRDLKVECKKSETFERGFINLCLVPLDEDVQPREELVVYCPVLMEGDDKAEAAINILRHSHDGLWVGANNVENGAIACVEVLNIDGKFTTSLLEYRKKKAEKVKSADKAVRAGR